MADKVRNVRKNRINTKLEIIQLGTRMFLEDGYSNTSIHKICKQLGISLGNFTFHFPTKEHLLLQLTKDLTTFHMNAIISARQEGSTPLFSFCREITAQIALCADYENVRDMYLAVYTCPMTVAFVKDWTAEKNRTILSERFPEWTFDDFRLLENVTNSIERGAIAEPCTEKYPLEEKIRLTLDSIMRLYEVSPGERRAVIDAILKTDYHKAADDIITDFVKYEERINRQALDDVMKSSVSYLNRMNK